MSAAEPASTRLEIDGGWLKISTRILPLADREDAASADYVDKIVKLRFTSGSITKTVDETRVPLYFDELRTQNTTVWKPKEGGGFVPIKYTDFRDTPTSPIDMSKQPEQKPMLKLACSGLPAPHPLLSRAPMVGEPSTVETAHEMTEIKCGTCGRIKPMRTTSLAGILKDYPAGFPCMKCKDEGTTGFMNKRSTVETAHELIEIKCGTCHRIKPMRRMFLAGILKRFPEGVPCMKCQDEGTTGFMRSKTPPGVSNTAIPPPPPPPSGSEKVIPAYIKTYEEWKAMGYSELQAMYAKTLGIEPKLGATKDKLIQAIRG